MRPASAGHRALTPTLFDLAGDNYRSAGSGILDYANAVLRDQPASPTRDGPRLRYSYPVTPEQLTHRAILLSPGPARPAARPAAHHRRPRPFQRVRRGDLRSDLRGPPAPRRECCPRRPRTCVGPGPVGRRRVRRREHPRMAGPDPRRSHPRDPAQHRRLLPGQARRQEDSSGARSVITATENAITAFLTGKTPRTKTAKRSSPPTAPGSSSPEARSPTGSSPAPGCTGPARELEEVFSKARLLRLLHATDALAWGLNDIWDGQASYPGAADTVRRILADEMISGRPAESHPVTLMNMHKSKGKEFDAVIIVEGLHHARLLDRGWDASRITRQRRRAPGRDHPGPAHRLLHAPPGRRPANAVAPGSLRSSRAWCTTSPPHRPGHWLHSAPEGIVTVSAARWVPGQSGRRARSGLLWW